MTQHTPPHLQSLIAAEPDLVDRIFDYLLAEFPWLTRHELEQVKAALREEFVGERPYVRNARTQARPAIVRDILALFNGRNATEVARTLNISRATVYRVLKQAGRRAGDERPSQFCLK